MDAGEGLVVGRAGKGLGDDIDVASVGGEALAESGEEDFGSSQMRSVVVETEEEPHGWFVGDAPLSTSARRKRSRMVEVWGVSVSV